MKKQKLNDIERRMTELWETAHRAMLDMDFAVAKTALWGIIRIDHYNAAAYNRIAIVYVQQGRSYRSTILFRVATRIEPGASSFHNLGLIYYERKKYRNSRRAFLNSLSFENDSPERHIAMAKVEEMLGNYPRMVSHLGTALKIDGSLPIKKLYTTALKEHKEETNLSDEIIDALANNLTPWKYEAIEEYEKSLGDVKSLYLSTEKLLKKITRKRSGVSSRSMHTAQLATIFLHNVAGCVVLLQQNYSHSAFTVSRSLIETYIKCGYALRFSSYRGYAEIEKTAALGKIGANERLIRSLSPIDNRVLKLRSSNRKLRRRLAALENRYIRLASAPSLRQMALLLDNNQSAKHYNMYAQIYQPGSDYTHVERRVVVRAARLSGTSHAGLFVDSRQLTILLKDILLEFGQKISELPEVSNEARRIYRQATKGHNRELG